MINTTEFRETVDPGIKKHFVDSYKEVETPLEKIFKLETQESKTDVYQNYTGLSTLDRVNEGERYLTDKPMVAFGLSLTPVKYGREMSVTLEQIQFSKTKEIYDGAKMLGRAARRHVDKAVASIFNNSQDTAYTSYTDGKPLASTQHLRADGGANWSNASATGIEFNAANLEVGLLNIELSQPDDRGELIDLMATRLIVPSHLRSQAIKVLKSENASGTADNDVNPYAFDEFYGTISCMVLKRLTSNTRWVLQDVEQSKLIWAWTTKPTIKKNTELGFSNDVPYIYKGFYQAAFGWSDPRGIFVSAGNKASYTS
jgi:hypothetical protein